MKNYKKILAFSLAATMMIGSTMTVFAGDIEGGEEGDTPETPSASVAGIGEGTGSYEGGEMKYPTLQVTLPTIPEGTYDYIADPNGLIVATSHEKYGEDATFTGTTGIFFKSGEDTYTADSAALSLTNENAQDIDVTVKLEQKTAGDSSIKYATSGTFEATDKENKLYLAVTDGAETNPKTAALAGTTPATIKTTVAGVPGNYTGGYNSETDSYGYQLKAEDDLTDWNECSFKLTGAINKNAKWGDNVNFPAIKVTWSYAEHTDSYLSASTMTASSNSVTLSLPDGVTLSKVELIAADGSKTTALSGTTHYTLSGTTFTLPASSITAWVKENRNIIKITFSDSKYENVTLQ